MEKMWLGRNRVSAVEAGQIRIFGVIEMRQK